MHQNAFGVLAEPGPAGGAHSAPPGLYSWITGERKGEREEGEGRNEEPTGPPVSELR